MNQKIKPRIWLLLHFLLPIVALLPIAALVIHVDPFFHYHPPYLEDYFYTSNNQRSQNDGIIKHFEYDALITGTSMAENFKTSEMDEIFGTTSIKVAYSGGSYKEINDSLIVALRSNPNLKTIVRGLDMQKFIEDKDALRQDLGKYPTYLYDDYLFNDVNYLFNRDVIFGRIYPMLLERNSEDFEGGITSFDAYSNWAAYQVYGINAVCPDGIEFQTPEEPVHLTEEEKEIVLGTVRQNITSLAEEYPDVTFYYFFPPYSAVWWGKLLADGTIYRQHEAETIVIEQILPYSNIKLFSFNNLTDITTDINHYKDSLHYGSWINSLMLAYMHAGKCQLTYDNYKEYLEDELKYYLCFDYTSLNGQNDYKNDYDAETLIMEAIRDLIS